MRWVQGIVLARVITAELAQPSPAADYAEAILTIWP